MKKKPMSRCGTKWRKEVQQKKLNWLLSIGFQLPLGAHGTLQPGGSEETFVRSISQYTQWGIKSPSRMHMVEINRGYYNRLKNLVKKRWPHCKIDVRCDNQFNQKPRSVFELDTPESFRDIQTGGRNNKHQKIIECLRDQVGLLVVYGAQRYSGKKHMDNYRLLAHQYGYKSKRFPFRGTNGGSMILLVFARKDLCWRRRKCHTWDCNCSCGEKECGCLKCRFKRDFCKKCGEWKREPK